MNRRSYLKTSFALVGGLLLPAGVFSLVGRTGLAQNSEHNRFSGRIMGTGYSVVLGSIEDSIDELQFSVLAELNAIDSSMSTWRSDSEISLFNRSQQNDWQSISADTMTVIEYARRTSEQTLGAFDASVAPLVNLWGFGPTQAQSITEFSKPSPNAIAKTAYRVGYQSINVDTNSRAIRKDSTTNELDLSGIAKGFAVDKVALILDAYGINNYLVELGGELRSRGRNSQGKAWRVAIERPSTKQRSVYRIINLENSAVATSGDYRNFFLDGGVRYSHTIDPRTGSPSNHELASVSVIAETTMQADSLSTAFMVMGPGDALSYANTHGIAAHLILRSASGKLAEIHSDAFASFLS